MKVAIIDLGTNTFNMLIVELNNDKTFNTLLNTKSAVMLGEEGINEGYISDKAFTRAYSVLRGFSQLLQEFKCEKVVAFGTSAIRGASNSEEFISKIADDLNIHIEPISGDQEAQYIYEGVAQAIQFTKENYLIIDIGGGSVEFIIANKEEMLWKKSLKLGGARLMERFKPSDPMQSSEVDTITHYLRGELKVLSDVLQKYPVSRLVGSSGAFDSFAEMIYYTKTGLMLPNTTTRYFMTTLEYFNLHQQILSKDRRHRLDMPGMDAVRVDTILMAGILTKVVLEISKVPAIIQASYSLKEGVAVKLAKEL